MMTRLIRIGRDMFIYGCVATVLALVVMGVLLWTRVGLSQEKIFRMLAALYDVDLVAMELQQRQIAQATDREDVAYDEILRRRAETSLDADLREQAINHGLADLRQLQQDLREERRRYDLLKQSFDAELEKLQNIARNDAILDVQRTLETVKPKQAKDHLLRMLPDGFAQLPLGDMESQQQRAIIDVVTIVKAMTLDKRKKILAEFRTEEEARQLAEILRLIRLGVPEVELISDARRDLQQFKHN